ncbi:hypothetical protein GOODEAATRI_000703, partial [Goodea atripinnis]
LIPEKDFSNTSVLFSPAGGGMSLSPVIGTEVPEAANGLATPVSLENGPHAPISVKYGGSRLPGNGAESMDGSSGHTENHVDMGNRLHTVESTFDTETNIIERTSSLSLHSPQVVHPSVHDGTGTGSSEPKDTDISEATRTEDMVLMWDSAQHAEPKDPCQQGGSDIAEIHQTEAESVERRLGSRGKEDDGEEEKQDMETDEKNENSWRNTGGRTEKAPSQHYSSSAPGPSTSSCSTPQPALLASDDTPCPPHVMAQVWVRNNRGMQDSKSLDEISQACGGTFLSRFGLYVLSSLVPSSIVDDDGFFSQVVQEPEEVAKGMYTLMARCEELDRSMQPIHTLAAQIRDIKRTLDALEAICK